MSGGLPYRPFPLVLSAPSGTGKTSIARELVSRGPNFVFSVSATTRAPRPGEEQGRDYEFIARPVFEAMIERDELAEWAEVHGNLYGTTRRALEEATHGGRHAVLDIDVQGARQVRENIPRAVLIFVFPPAAEDLLARLSARGTEDREEVFRRLRTAKAELDAAEIFDYVIVNDELESAVSRIQAVVEAESRARGRLQDLQVEVTRIRKEIDAILAGEGAQGALGG